MNICIYMFFRSLLPIQRKMFKVQNCELNIVDKMFIKTFIFAQIKLLEYFGLLIANLLFNFRVFKPRFLSLGAYNLEYII